MPHPARPTLLSPAGLVDSPAFSHVAIIPPGSTTILVGGQNGVGPDGKVVGADTASQSEQAFANIRTALAAAGATMRDVVQFRLFLAAEVDLQEGFAAFQRVWDPADDPPLVTAAIVQSLAVPGALLEIEAVAALPA